MKKFVLILMILSSYQVFACKQESQFHGIIKSGEMIDDTCMIQFESFSHYALSFGCPLFMSDALQNLVTTPYSEEKCAEVAGTFTSGYLVRPSGFDQIFLD